VRTRPGSRGRRSTPSRRSSTSRARRCRQRSLVCWSSRLWWCTRRGGRGDRLGIGSAFNRPDHRASCGRSTSPIHGASWGASTSPMSGHEVVATHGGRSAVAVRALPGARRSLRSLPPRSDRPIDSCSLIVPLAARCPSGEEAQRDVGLGARRGGRRREPAWSPLRRLPASRLGISGGRVLEATTEARARTAVSG
jgi:hypothetical protein